MSHQRIGEALVNADSNECRALVAAYLTGHTLRMAWDGYPLTVRVTHIEIVTRYDMPWLAAEMVEVPG